MKKNTIIFLAVAGIAAIAALFFFGHPQNEPLSRKAQSIKDAAEWEFERTKDPALGYPPVERLLLALEQTRQRQAELADQMSSRGAVANPRWRERGPNNIGGRTRVILIDRNDPSRKTVWAAGVAGGLWKTTDIDAQDPQWQKINDYKENMAIGAMAQDPNNPLIMYVDVAFTDVVNGTVTGDIFDAQGRLISRSEAAAGGLPSVRFNVPYLAAGVYFLRVQIEGEQEAHTVKLLKIN